MFDYTIRVDVTIEGGVIRKIDWQVKEDRSEDPDTNLDYMDYAVNGRTIRKNVYVGVLDQILEKQSADDVDVVSRATYSSKALIEAMKMALEVALPEKVEETSASEADESSAVDVESSAAESAGNETTFIAGEESSDESPSESSGENSSESSGESLSGSAGKAVKAPFSAVAHGKKTTKYGGKRFGEIPSLLSEEATEMSLEGLVDEGNRR